MFSKHGIIIWRGNWWLKSFNIIHIIYGDLRFWFWIILSQTQTEDERNHFEKLCSSPRLMNSFYSHHKEETMFGSTCGPEGLKTHDDGVTGRSGLSRADLSQLAPQQHHGHKELFLKTWKIFCCLQLKVQTVRRTCGGGETRCWNSWRVTEQEVCLEESDLTTVNQQSGTVVAASCCGPKWEGPPPTSPASPSTNSRLVETWTQNSDVLLDHTLGPSGRWSHTHQNWLGSHEASGPVFSKSRPEPDW